MDRDVLNQIALDASREAYGDVNDLLPAEGFVRRPGSSIVDPATGLRVTIYERAVLDADGQATGRFDFVVAFAGTEDLQDAYADVRLGWDQWEHHRDVLLGELGGLATLGTIHFTGHSLGGALAQYAAYEFSYSYREALRRASQPVVSPDITLTTFNSLGGIEALAQHSSELAAGPLERYSYQVFSDVDTAHFFVRGDIVTRIGDGHVGGNTQELVLGPGSTPTLDFLTAHTLDTLYAAAGAAGGVQALLSGATPASPAYLDLADGQWVAATLGGLFNDKDFTALESGLRLAGGLVLSLAVAPAADIARLADAFIENFKQSGGYDDAGFAAQFGLLALSNWSVVRSAISFLGGTVGNATILGVGAALVLAAGIADLLGSGDRAGTESMLRMVADGVMPEGSFDAEIAALVAGPRGDALLRAGLWVAAVEGASSEAFVTRVGAVMQGLGFGSDEATRAELHQHLAGGEDWLGDTLQFLGQRAQARGLDPLIFGLDLARAAAESVADFLGAEGSVLSSDVAGALGEHLVGLAASVANAVVGYRVDDPRGLLAWQGDVSCAAAEQYREIVGRHLATLGASAEALRGSLLEVRGLLEQAGQGLQASSGTGGLALEGAMQALANASPELVLPYTVTLRYAAAPGGQTLRLTLDGAAGEPVELVGAAVEAYGGADAKVGAREWLLSVPEGTREAAVFAVFTGGLDQFPVPAFSLSAALATGEGLQTHDGGIVGQVAVSGPAAPGSAVYLTAGADEYSLRPAAFAATPAVFADGGNDQVGVWGPAPLGAVVYGGSGDDVLDARFLEVGVQGVGVEMQGGSQNDVLQGSGGGDRLDGGAEHDVVFGYEGRDWVQGGAGNDWLTGDEGDDLILDRDGADVLLGGAGADWVGGGPGADRMFGDATGLFGLWDGATGTVRAPVATDGFAPGDYGIVLEVDAALAGDDVLEGGEGGDSLFGGMGDDTLLGGADGDHLEGEAGSDRLEGGEGGDVLWGDRCPATVAEDSRTLYEATVAAGIVRYQWRTHPEGADATGDDTLLGGAGSDSLFGQDGDDFLLGEAQNDALVGGAGGDVLVGGAGSDYLNGGKGDDVYRFESVDGTDLIEDEEGLDTVAFGASVPAGSIVAVRVGSDLALTDASGSLQVRVSDWFSTGPSIEVVEWADGTRWTAEELTRAALGQVGSSAADILEGYDAHDDVLEGGAGDDQLSGYGGRDVLRGGAGADRLDGGAGDDTLEGGEGADLYLLGAGQDLVRDTGAAGEVNRLRLGLGTVSADVDAERVGEDLLLRWTLPPAPDTGDGGGGEPVPSSVTVRDYFADPARWSLELASGASVPLEELLGAVPPGGDPLRLVWESFEQALYARLTREADYGNRVGAGIDAPLETEVAIVHYACETPPYEPIQTEDGWYFPDVPGAYAGEGAYWTWTGTPPGTRFEYRVEVVTTDLAASATPPARVAAVAYVQSRRHAELVLDPLGGFSSEADGGSVSRRRVVDVAYEGEVGRGSGLPVVVPVSTETARVERIYGTDLPEHVGAVYGSAPSLVDGRGGDDGISGGEGVSDLLYGGEGNDTLEGLGGGDVLAGGGGSDLLRGGEGADTYHFFAGQAGVDVVEDDGLAVSRTAVSWMLEGGLPTGEWRDYEGVLDYLRWLPDAELGTLTDWLSQRRVPFTRQVDTVQVGAAAGEVTVERAEHEGRAAIALRWGETLEQGLVVPLREVGRDLIGYGVEQVVFTDGSRSLAELLASLPPVVDEDAPPDGYSSVWKGTAGADQGYGDSRANYLAGLEGNDSLWGLKGDDWLDGGRGDDALWAGAGDDVLRGGPGSDSLMGDRGADTYHFRAGDGADTISDAGGKGDRLVLGAGFRPVDVGLTRTGSDLSVALGAGDDRVTVLGWFGKGVGEIEQVVLHDGTTLLARQVDSLVQAMAGFTNALGVDSWKSAVAIAPDDAASLVSPYWSAAAG